MMVRDQDAGQVQTLFLHYVEHRLRISRVHHSAVISTAGDQADIIVARGWISCDFDYRYFANKLASLPGANGAVKM